MDLAIAWVVFPLVLAALCVGCGLLAERVAGIPLPGALIAPVGCAAIIAVCQLTTLSAATAKLSAPLIPALAIAGYGLRIRPTGRWPDLWASTAALAVL